MHCDADDANLLLWPVFLVNLDGLHGGEGRVCALQYLHKSAQAIHHDRSLTRPKTVFFPSRCGAAAYVTKNWLPLVPGRPRLAMLTTPRAWWRSAGRISSSKNPSGESNMLVPPLPLPVGSPPWIIKEAMLR